MICKCCVNKLTASYEFRVQVINSDYKLHNAIKDLENLNDSEMISNEVLEISLHNREENKSVERETIVEESCKTEPVSIENVSKQPDESEPRIGIIKLGEDCRANENLVKNLVCEYCGKKFNKSNQLFGKFEPVAAHQNPRKCQGVHVQILQQEIYHFGNLSKHKKKHRTT